MGTSTWEVEVHIEDEFGVEFVSADCGHGAEFVVAVEVHELVTLPSCPGRASVVWTPMVAPGVLAS
jgi:hypothetical protein